MPVSFSKFAAPLMVFAISLSSCSAGVDEAIWLEMPIPVCWESMDPEHRDGREWTQDAVEKSWVKAADISFTGWAGCKASSEGIRIAVVDTGPNVTRLGRELAGQPNGMTLNFNFANWGVGCAEQREYCIRALAVHEFGHAIGLAHEHNRDDRDLCEAEKQGPSPTFTVTAFDPSSIMNYCSKDWSNSGRLSALDVAGARMIYGPFTDETPATAKVRLMAEFYDVEGSLHPFELSDDIQLSNTKPSESQTLWLCNNTDRTLKVDLRSSLVSGRAAIAVAMSVTLIETADCKTDGIIRESWTEEFDLVRPFSDGGEAVEDGLGGFFVEHRHTPASTTMGATNFNILAYRSIGDEVVSKTCLDCVAASAEAIFSGQTPSTSNSEP